MSASSVVPSASAEIEADLAHAAHRQAVDARLRAHEPCDLDAALAVTEGADPRLVAQRLRALGLCTTAIAGPEPDQEPWTPELHARDFEWYFTPRCAAALAARVGRAGGSVLCLGTPTVAFALLAGGHAQRVTLVDRCPLAFGRHGDLARLEARQEDLASARLDVGAYDVAVLDAPWYPAALAHWLDVAAAAVRPRGRIVLALLPPLHRPSARADRTATLARARALGSVHVEAGWLQYATPRFEREAMAFAGIGVPSAWRRADLLEITVERTFHEHPAAPAPAPAPAWLRFVVGSQVIQLDPGASSEPGEVLRPIDGHGGFRYDSISTRDPRRADIGLWTSRSRVARVRRPAIVAALLERLAATGELRSLDDAQELRAVSADERRRALVALRAIVGPLAPSSG